MIKEKNIYILGSGWISSYGYGLFGSKPRFSFENKDLVFPDLQNYIKELPARIGRFDIYTKACFTAAVLALYDADMHHHEKKENIGIIAGSQTGVYDNDISFIKTTQEQAGAFSSPNIFSYTLPNVALGEIAVFFNLTGPSFCVSNDPECPGRDALNSAISMMESKRCTKALVGWAETSNNINYRRFLKGAMFALISLEKKQKVKTEFFLNKVTNFLELFE